MSVCNWTDRDTRDLKHSWDCRRNKISQILTDKKEMETLLTLNTTSVVYPLDHDSGSDPVVLLVWVNEGQTRESGSKGQGGS